MIPGGYGGINGMIIIYRGAIEEDGTIVKTSEILWSNTALDENHTPDPF